MLSIQAPQDLLPEVEYVCHVLLREMLGTGFRVKAAPEGSDFRLGLPNGNVLIVENHWEPATLSGIPPAASAGKAMPHPFQAQEDVVVLFGRHGFDISEKCITCGPDLFAAAFFMLTRWEEQVSGKTDKHGRFPAAESLAFRAGFLHRPVVNEWAGLLWEMLQRLGWQGDRPKRPFRLHISCDVDHPRLWWRPGDRLRSLGGALLKRGNLKEAAYLWSDHFFGKQDPYDVFDEWMNLFETHQLEAQFNFLGERPATSDCWYPLHHPFIRRLMENITRRGHRIGFHASYESFGDQSLFRHELASVRALSPQAVDSGRQHYLRFAVPDTWRQWQEAGMRSDSTLGYPEAEGFRCGICHDYPVFDSVQRKQLALREAPLLAMDVTLAHYRNYTPEQAFLQLDSLRRQVSKHGGDFTLLWHNSSWNTLFWRPWKKVFLDFIAACNHR